MSSKDKKYNWAERVFNTIVIFVKDIISISKYGQSLFFDTNFLIVDSNNKLDGRYNILLHFSKKIITETVADEVDVSVSSGKYKRISNMKFQTILKFEEFRAKNPNLCPLYYNLISWMHNPAIFNSASFHLNSYLREHVIDKKAFPRGEKIQQKLAKHFESEHLKLGGLLIGNDSMRKEWNKLGKIELSALSKKRVAIRKKDPNYFNDLKFISLSVLYMIEKKKNVTIYSADSDLVQLIFYFFSSFANEWTFKTLILDKVKKDNITFDMSSIEFYFDFAKIKDRNESLLREIYDDSRKSDYLILKMKYWNQVEKKYSTFSFRINKAMQSYLVNSWGNNHCLAAQNFTKYSSLGYRWYEPDPMLLLKGVDYAKVKVEVWEKDQRLSCGPTDQKTHEEYCLDFKNDMQNDYGFFSQFDAERLK